MSSSYHTSTQPTSLESFVGTGTLESIRSPSGSRGDGGREELGLLFYAPPSDQPLSLDLLDALPLDVIPIEKVRKLPSAREYAPAPPPAPPASPASSERSTAEFGSGQALPTYDLRQLQSAYAYSSSSVPEQPKPTTTMPSSPVYSAHNWGPYARQPPSTSYNETSVPRSFSIPGQYPGTTYCTPPNSPRPSPYSARL